MMELVKTFLCISKDIVNQNPTRTPIMVNKIILGMKSINMPFLILL